MLLSIHAAPSRYGVAQVIPAAKNQVDPTHDHVINVPLPSVHKQSIFGYNGKLTAPLSRTVIAFTLLDQVIPIPISNILFVYHTLYFPKTVEAYQFAFV